MLDNIYQDLYLRERKYWWSVGKRSLVVNLWNNLRKKQARYRVLEIGCGTGAMLNNLNKRPEVERAYGIDNSKIAIEYCHKNGLDGQLLLADSRFLPVKKELFDLVFAIDMLEHCVDDSKVIKEMYRVCKSEGIALITVPAFNFLWSEHDERLGHKRRYLNKELRDKFIEAGFKVMKCSYTNVFYFPIIVLLIISKKFIRRMQFKTDIIALPRFLNSFFTFLINIETRLLLHLNFPFGVSLMCVSKK